MPLKAEEQTSTQGKIHDDEGLKFSEVNIEPITNGGDLLVEQLDRGTNDNNLNDYKNHDTEYNIQKTEKQPKQSIEKIDMDPELPPTKRLRSSHDDCMAIDDEDERKYDELHQVGLESNTYQTLDQSVKPTSQTSPMEVDDFIDIVKIVTDQIVTNVSSAQG